MSQPSVSPGQTITPNPLPVSAAALPLPAGAATAANQATELTSLSTLNTQFSSGTAKTRVTLADGAQLDAFGRLRVSTPQTIFASKLVFDAQPLVWDDQQVSGGSTTSTYNTNQASVTLLATGNVAGLRARQTFRRFNYQPGKGMLFALTGILDESGGNAAWRTSRIGCFDSKNGFFFYYKAGMLGVGHRTFTSGSAVDALYPQSGWTVDKMDGTGASGLTLDVTKQQIFFVDFQWLGVGRIRFGVNIGGINYYVTEINFANIGVLVSLSNPNLPCRFEIQSDGTGSATTAKLRQICATAEIEGQLDDAGYPFSADTGATVLTTVNNTNTYALLALRLASANVATTIVPDSFSISSQSVNMQVIVSLILNPTVAGAAFTYNAITGSSAEYAAGVAANTVTGGTKIFSGVYASNKTGAFNERASQQELSLGSSIAGVSDVLVLCARPVPANVTDLSAAINWRELI